MKITAEENFFEWFDEVDKTNKDNKLKNIWMLKWEGILKTEGKEWADYWLASRIMAYEGIDIPCTIYFLISHQTEVLSTLNKLIKYPFPDDTTRNILNMYFGVEK